MSDILLSVGLQTGTAETSQIQDDLDKIIAKIDKNPPKVKVGLQVDQSAINHFKSQLTQIVNSVGLSSGAPITVNISGIGEITAQASKASKALDGVTSAANAAGNAVNSIGDGKQKSALMHINTLLRTMQSNYAKWTAAQAGSASDSYAVYGEQIHALETLKLQVDANNISFVEFQERLSSIKLVASEAALEISKVGEDHAAKNIKTLAINSDEYRNAVERVSSELARVTNYQEKWTAAKTGRGAKDYDSLTEYRTQLEMLLSKLRDGTMTQEQFHAEVNNISRGVKTAASNIKMFGEDTKTLGDRVKGLAAKFGTWFSVSQVIMMGVRSVKKMVSAVIEIDTAMTELKKVTDETDATYDRFLTNATKRAKLLGATVADTVTATADFARLGYSIGDAEKLADVAIIYKNIGDGIQDITTASESIISTMQAFGYSAEDAMLIVDKFNEVGNNYAISSAGVGEALKRSAAAMAAANNTLDETIALATAANTIVQNPESVGTTLKTVSMFLRAAKTEAEAAGESTEGMAGSVSELRDEILSLTGQRVDIQIDEDTFKSTYQILKELSVVWNDLTDVSQANILEMVGGKRNANIVSALLENFSIAEDALATAANSAGSAMAENEKHLESIQGKISILKASFEAFSQNLIGSDLVKFFVDLGTGILNLLNGIVKVINVLGGLKTVLLATASVLAISKAAWIVHAVAMSNIVGVFNKVISAIKMVINIIPMAISAWKGFAAGTVSASAAMQASIPVIGLVLSAVTLLVGSISLYNNKIDESRQKAKENADTASALSDDIASLTNRFITLSEAVENDDSVKEDLISTEDELIDKLDIEKSRIEGLTDSYTAYTNAIKSASVEKLKEQERDIRAGLSASKSDALDVVKDYLWDVGTAINGESTIRIVGTEAGRGTDESKKAQEKLFEAGVALEEAGFTISEETTYTKAKSEGWGFTSGVGIDISGDTSSIEGITQIIDELGSALDIIERTAGSDTAFYKNVYDVYSGLKESVSGYSDKVADLNRNLAEQYFINGLIGRDVPDTRDGFDAYRQSVIDAAVASGSFVGSTEDIIFAIDDVLSKQQQFAPFYDKLKNLKDELTRSGSGAQERVKRYLGDLTSDDGLVYLSTIKDVASTIDDYVPGVSEFSSESEAYMELAHAADVYGVSVDSLIALLVQLGYIQEDVASAMAKKQGELKTELDAVKSAMAEQAANGSITAEKYDALIASSKDYASCIEFENGFIQLNTEKAKELLKAKTELQILELEQAKIKEAENYKEIANAIAEADASDTDFIATKQAELEVSGQLVQKYSVMQSELAETLSAYTAWKEAQNEPETGDMYDDTLKALEQIQEGLDSGKVGTAKFKASVEMLIPEASKDDVAAYIESLKRYLTDDSTGVSNFISDAITDGLMLDDGSGNITIAADKTVKDFCDALKITPSMAQAIFGELEEYGWEFDWDVNDFIGAIDPVTIPTEVDMAELEALYGQLSDYRAQLAEIESKPVVIQADVQNLQEKIAITEQAIEDAGGVVPVDTTDAEGQLQAVQEDLDKIAEKADIVAAKIIGDLGASETVISLQSVLTKLNEIDNRKISDKYMTVHISEKTESTGGQANANGTDGAKGGRTLVGELGRELVVSGDRYYTVGEHGAEFVNLKPGDIVFNNRDTEKIFAGRRGASGQSMMLGSPLNRPQMVYINDGGGAATVSGGGKDINININPKISGSGTNVEPGKGNSNSNKGNSSSGSSSGGSGKDDKSNWFEEQLAEHKHLVEMDKESIEDYLKWLNDAYKKAYDENLIDLNDYYKFEEEVYRGLQDLFKDHLNDKESEISMLEGVEGTSGDIINIYNGLIQDIEAELNKAYAYGLDQNNEYVQFLLSQWNEYHDAVADLREDAEADAKNSVNDLVEYRIKMLKQEIEDQKDALKKKLDYLKEFYDEQREMLRDQYDEEKYLEEQQEKRKAVTDIDAELEMLKHDDSAWAQKRKLELQEQRKDASKELSDFEKEHALNETLDMLDSQQEAQEAKIQAEIDALDAKLNDPHALYNQALSDIKSNTQALYDEFIAYNRKHGTGNDQDIADMWEDAYKADLEYQETHGGEHLNDIPIGNYTGYKPPEAPKPPEPDEPTEPPKPASSESKPDDNKPSLAKGSSIQVKSSATHFGSKSGGVRMASFVPGGKYTVYQTSGNEVLIGRDGVYTGWINKSDIVGYRSGTGHSIGGLAQFDEDGRGSEYIFESSDGNRYRMFGEGSKVLNSDATNFLYDFATNGGSVLTKMFADLLKATGLGNISKPTQVITLSSGNIIVQGSADSKTVSEIRRAQRSELEWMLKSLNSLNK